MLIWKCLQNHKQIKLIMSIDELKLIYISFEFPQNYSLQDMNSSLGAKWQTVRNPVLKQKLY